MKASNGNISILVGDCVELMRGMPDKSVHCCVTSPPYFGLRDYGVDGQIGLESSPDEYVAALVTVFGEARRVLRDDGTLWLNLGDSYTGSANAGGEATRTCHGAPNARDRNLPSKRGAGLKPKDLIGIPWRVAFALQADGWYLRQDIIWHKPNPMPESVRDRCTKAHEYIFLLSKSSRYYFDAEAIRDAAVSTGPRRDNGEGDRLIDRGMYSGRAGNAADGKRNKRSVWTVTTRPFKGAHFATFPPDLIEPCILAGCPEGGTVLDPFGGSGTTAGVAAANGRAAIICELNPEYAELVGARVKGILEKHGKPEPPCNRRIERMPRGIEHSSP